MRIRPSADRSREAPILWCYGGIIGGILKRMDSVLQESKNLKFLSICGRDDAVYCVGSGIRKDRLFPGRAAVMERKHSGPLSVTFTEFGYAHQSMWR